ncbi:LacI family transcriptional regulator [Eubacteriales bacterium OttesenSCG-928-N13]|nr:LacI family transcriptional regulator [Eubacteriales bacterium OttesenSCG-928-N13]
MARATIRDIAQATGLSITAVSLVLNNRPNKISAASQQAIRETAERMRYVSNQQKRMTAVKRIAVVVPDLVNFFFSSLISGVDSAISEGGHHLMIGFTNNNPQREQNVVRSMYAQGVDGIIITTSTVTTTSGYRQLFQNSSVPVILVDRVHPSFSYSSMTYNHQKGAYFAVKHLLDLGHRRIACLSGDGEQSYSTSRRMRGYLLAFEEAGLPAPENGIYFGNYLEDSGYQYADDIFKRGFTGLFSCNDMMAYGFYKRANELNKSIPEDISVVGYDDLFLSNLLDPPLTTVRQDPLTLGREAVKRLLVEIDSDNSMHQDISYEPTLIIRRSTQAPSGS